MELLSEAGYLATILVFFRIGGIMLPVPIFGSNNIPANIKVWFVLLLSIIMVPVTLDQFNPEIIDSFSSLLFYGTSEFVIGLSYGLISSVFLNAVYVAGAIIDMNIGLSIISVISPQDEQEIPVSANLMYLFGIMIFLATDMHHVLIRGIMDTFKIIPIGTGIFDFTQAGIFNDYISTSFSIGFQLSAPFILTMLVIDIILGLLSKAMPAMNIFVLGLPLKILIGLIMYMILMPYYSHQIQNLFDLMFKMMNEYIRGIGP